MKKALIVISHPGPDTSLNHQLAKAAKKGFEKTGREVDIWDLYKMGFNPLVSESELKYFGHPESHSDDISELADKLNNDYDIVTFVHPILYFTLPAMLKGFLERMASVLVLAEEGKTIFKPTTDLEKCYLIQTGTADYEDFNQDFSQEFMDKLFESSFKRLGFHNLEIMRIGGIQIKSDWEISNFIQEVEDKMASSEIN